jgi:tRNA threonylcarbamoyladenosine biosynthesis protein TsaE
VVVREDIDETALVGMARALAPAVSAGGAIHLVGELGAGKTTFARALLVALGVDGRVKSPTYSLIESYTLGSLTIQHLDLYRIAAADEVEWLGLRDLDVGRHLWLIEWPERAVGALPSPDLIVHLAHAAHGRDLRLEAVSPVGRQWLGIVDPGSVGPFRTAS